MSLGLFARYGLTRAASGPPPSGFATDFGEYTAGSPPGDWTASGSFVTLNIVSEAGSVSGQHLNVSQAGNGTRIITWDDVTPTDEDVEILALIRYAASASNRTHGVHARGDASSVTGYAMGTETSTNELGQLYRITSATTTGLTQVGGTFTKIPDNAWAWWRFRVEGTTLSAKSWADGDSEPGSWQASETDANITAAGTVGLLARRTSGTTTFDCAYFAVAFAGDTAPGP